MYVEMLLLLILIEPFAVLFRRAQSMRKPSRSSSGEPSVFCVGIIHVSVTPPLPGWETSISKGPSFDVASPSETVIEICPWMPMSLSTGVPYRRQLLLEKLAHAGLLDIEQLV